MAAPEIVALPRQAAEPECFETPDAPLYVGPVEEDDPISEDVVKEKHSSQQAFARFKDSSVDASGVDFSESIAQKEHAPGYVVANSVYEMGAGAEENVVAKYNRLKYEVEGLVAQVEALGTQGEADASSAESAAAVAAKVQALHHQLQKVRLSTALGADYSSQTTALLMQTLTGTNQKASQDEEPQKQRPADPDTELPQKLVVTQMVRSAQVADLERRVDAIERSMGPGLPKALDALSSELAVERGLGTVQGVLAAMQRRLGLLDGRLVEALAKRLAQLAQQQQQLEPQQNKEGGDAGRHEAKISALYDALSKHDTDVLLPELLARLQSLQVVHKQMADFTATLTLLQATQDDLSEMLKGQGAALSQLQDTFSANSATITANVGALVGRLDALGV